MFSIKIIFAGGESLQAVILAAGMGKRLGKYTKEVTKGMVRVVGKTLLEHALDSLVEKVDRVILVVGYKAEKVKEFLGNSYKGLTISYIDNPHYETTNNIYSLWLAAEEMKKDDTLLLESDVIFEREVIERLVKTDGEAVAVIHKFEDWMDGTVVILDDYGNIASFLDKSAIVWENSANYYKTVNIYKFSKEFFSKYYFPFLKAYVESNGYSSYYEVVLSLIAGLKNIKIKPLIIDGLKWYEIDTPEDLWSANVIFSDLDEKYELLKKSYGGYWRFPSLKDFCYLVNPYFPSESFLSRMKKIFENLITSYPSGRERIKHLLSEMFGVSHEMITAGNGASEIIKVLSEVIKGSFGMMIPTFEEYPNRIKNIITRKPENDGFRYSEKDVIEFFEDVDNIVLINPDNPSGNFINREGILNILDSISGSEKNLILDESFVDFANPDKRFTMIVEDVLMKYPNLIVVKSISKSYGVPGIRLGVVATSNANLLRKVEENMPIWNINSFAEYFLQKMEPYKDEYKLACDLISKEREFLINELSKVEGIRVYPSQANFVLCRVENSQEIALKLLANDIFIKDCYGKLGIDKPKYIRLSIRNREDNKKLIESIKSVLEGKDEV